MRGFDKHRYRTEPYNAWIEAAITIPAALISGAVALFASNYGIYQKEQERRQEETSKLVKREKEQSEGEDRIWSTDEKRAFLNKFGIGGTIQKGQELYLDVEGDYDNISARLSYADGNSEKIGSIERAELVRYVESSK